jgi:ethanolamine-phosphate cytidylyltransferase
LIRFQNCYQAIKEAGRFDTVPRTKAISTTNIIQRMLCLPPEQLPHDFDKKLVTSNVHQTGPLNSYLPTTHRIAQFASTTEPGPHDKIVYVDGTFDLLHPGHISFLKKAKAEGDFLVVGIYSDPDLKMIEKQYQIMTLQERVLNVLSIKYVDDVIIGAPFIITKELMD